eukprot:3869276-Lingulodinium_polyedra.AAC.1
MEEMGRPGSRGRRICRVSPRQTVQALGANEGRSWARAYLAPGRGARRPARDLQASMARKGDQQARPVWKVHPAAKAAAAGPGRASCGRMQ